MIRGLALAALSLAVACGGDNLVLPGEGTPTTIKVTAGDAQQGTVNTVLPDSIVVQVLDAGNRPVPGQVVNFAVVAGGGTASPASDVTDAQGLAAVEWALGPAAGTQQLRAQATGGAAPANLAVIASATAGASTAANLAKVSGDAQTDVAGSTLNDSLIVKVTDGVGNPVAGVEVSWTITGGGTVSDTRTTSGADGLTGVRRTLGAVAGPQTTVATAAGLNGSPVTFTATATVGSAGKLVITTQPSSSAQSGVPFAQQPRVQVRDANNNNVAVAGLAVTAEIVSGPAGATLIGVPTVSTNGNGLAVFSGLGISGPVGTYTLNFKGANLVGTTSNPINLGAGAPAQLTFITQPSNTAAGAAISPAVKVALQDVLGQTVTSATNAVTLSIGTNPGSGTLGGTLTVSAVDGVATFSDLSINVAASGYTLRAASAGLPNEVSTPFTILSGTAGSIVPAATIPATTIAGGIVTPDAAVKVTDGSGNPVAGVVVTFSAVGGGSVTGGTQTTNAQGIATVGSWTIGTEAGTEYTLTATSVGLPGSPVTFATSAVAGPPAALEIVTQPGSPTQSGVALSPQPVVRLIDAFGNVVPLTGRAVTAALVSPPAGASLTNPTEGTVDGVATFSGLAITGPEGTYTLSFTSTGVTSATADPISLVAVSASQSDLSASPTTITAGDAGTTVTVTVRSGTGTLVSGVTVVPDDGAANGAFTPSSAITDGSGVATFTYTSTEAGIVTLSATANGIAITGTASVTVEPAGAATQTSSRGLSPSSAGADHSVMGTAYAAGAASTPRTPVTPAPVTPGSETVTSPRRAG